MANQTGLWGCSAADRNKGPILDVLEEVLPERGLVLEIASGAGRHVAYFAAALAGLVWQPSEPDAEMRRMIAAAAAGTPNVREPLDLDVLRQPWPISAADAIVNINMIHVTPWDATVALMGGAAAVLSDGGVLYMYGPYRRFGGHTAPSNAAFHERLRMQDGRWGLRDMEDVERLAGEAGLVLERRVAMPANNFSLVFRRSRHRESFTANC
ncbi:MAG: DUF938 domain-containing protein [Gammaproteobacteria bacterium]|nr:DUF938 domain-containing protein [Gammaproteobacteria bacterium]